MVFDFLWTGQGTFLVRDLVKFGCGNPGILVTFWTGQENYPTFNT